MCALKKIPVWQRVKRAVEALGGRATKREIRDWILEHFPGTLTGTIACQTLICTVNRQARVRFWQNERPRAATAQYDFLFENPAGDIVFYSRRKHGEWEIAQTAKGLIARPVEEAVFRDAEKIIARGGGFGDSAKNRLVERAAVAKVIQHLEDLKFQVISRESEGIGYDLDAFRGNEELHVEVKGVSGTRLQFPVTRGEVRRATTDPLFRLMVVTRARSAEALLHEFDGPKFIRKFGLDPLLYMATTNNLKGARVLAEKGVS